MGRRKNMGQQPVKMRMRDVIGRMRITDIAAAIDIGPAGNNAKEVRHMFAQRVNVNINKERREFWVLQQLVIDKFGYAGGDPAAVVYIQR